MKSATIVLAAASAVSAAPNFGGPAVSGKSTHYGGNLSGGTCSFTTYKLPAGMHGTAFSGSAWDNASACGACVEVTGPKGNKIKAMVVDKCPECEPSHLDLFINAFGELEDPGKGIISTSYNFVPCGITSPLKLHNKSGTSRWWFSMQVVNANEPVASLEVSTDGGSSWKATKRQDYNFFENPSGFGTDKVDVRIKSITGKTVTVKGVSIESDLETTAGGNFEGTESAAQAPKQEESATKASAKGASTTAAPKPTKPVLTVSENEPEAPVTSEVQATATEDATATPTTVTRPKCKGKGKKKSKRQAKAEL